MEVESLKTLMASMRGWLGEAEAQELFSVSEESVELNEEGLGSYEVTALKLVTPRGDVIRVTPRARYVVGAYGRVDLLCPPNKAILVQNKPGQWAFASLSLGQSGRTFDDLRRAFSDPSSENSGWTFEELNEESFWKNLSELLP